MVGSLNLSEYLVGAGGYKGMPGVQHGCKGDKGCKGHKKVILSVLIALLYPTAPHYAPLTSPCVQEAIYWAQKKQGGRGVQGGTRGLQGGNGECKGVQRNVRSTNGHKGVRGQQLKGA